MNEEKKAIEFLKHSLYEYEEIDTSVMEYIDKNHKIIYKLILKQQKEIKARLEEIDSLYKMMSAKDDEIETLKESQLVLYGDNGQIVGVLKYTDDVIKKDKINAKIEELENTYDENDKNDYHNQFIVDCVAILEELLSGQESDQEGGQENE